MDFRKKEPKYQTSSNCVQWKPNCSMRAERGRAWTGSKPPHHRIFFLYCCTLYFSRTCFFVLIILNFALLSLRTTQTTMPLAGFHFVLCTSPVPLLCPDCPGCIYFRYCTTHTTETSMPPAGFEPATPASDQPQTFALERSVTGIGCSSILGPSTQ